MDWLKLGGQVRVPVPLVFDPWSLYLHYFFVLTPVVNWRHAIIFFEKLTKIVNIIVANAV